MTKQSDYHFKTGDLRKPELLCKFINPETGEKCKAYKWKESLEEFCVYHAKDISKGDLDIIKCIENPRIFGELFGEDQTSWQGWKSILAGAFGLELGGNRLELFKKLTNRTKRPKKQVRELWCISGRRSGKSWTVSTIAVFLALYREYPQLRKGELGHVVIVSPNRENGRVILGYCKEILEHLERKKKSGSKIKYLRESIEIPDKNIVIDIKTSNIVSGRGVTAVAVILDELAFFPKESSANPDKEVLGSLVPCTATIDNALIIGISSAYSKEGVLYEKWQRYYGQNSDEVLVIQAKSLDLNPTLSNEFISGQLADNYEVNSAEYLSIWRTDVSQFIPDQILTNSIVPNRVQMPVQPKVRYLAFVDGASGTASKGADSFTMAIAHKDKKTGQTIISGLWEYQPPFSPKNVVTEFAKICKEYGVKEVIGDKWSLGVLGDLWKMENINYRTNEISTSETYQEALVFLSTGTVELLDDQRSINQLRGLERYVRSSGRDHVSHRPNGHDDLSTVIMGCIYMLNKGIKMNLDDMMYPSTIDSVQQKPSIAKAMEDEFIKAVRAGHMKKDPDPML